MEKEKISLVVNGTIHDVIQLHGDGQCECYGCFVKKGWNRKWTDWCYEYKGRIYCYECLKEVLSAGECADI